MKTCTKCGIEKDESEFNIYKGSNRTGKLYAQCKQCKTKANKLRYVKDKINILNCGKLYRQNNKEKISVNKKKYYKNNKQELLEYRNQYYQGNREQIIHKSIEYNSNKKKNDTDFKLQNNLRSRLNQAIKNNYKSGSAVKNLGCSISELKFHLESLWQPGMSWENWTHDGWHIDHIIPFASIDVNNREELLKVLHYTNLQPLWAKDNLKKGSKMPDELENDSDEIDNIIEINEGITPL